ncbi:conserved hypothetical protein [Ricinus communis]|uniref:Uncharacterized protein n=1 Tax=Ricinus communis TaxID=3988 RepID=B9SHY2_RICCO|nr:conserved hypothetical protein [Ricinus communis]
MADQLWARQGMVQLARAIGSCHPVQEQKKWKRKCTLPTQALSCSGSKGLSQPDLLNPLTKWPVLKQIQAPPVLSFVNKIAKEKKLYLSMKRECSNCIIAFYYCKTQSKHR